MAMYENLGFCPSNSFLSYLVRKKEIPAIWERTKKLLGDRIGYMVYTEAGYSYYGCYVVDCLAGSTSTLGLEVACKLQAMIPECEYARIGRKILVTDVINPFQIPGLRRSGTTYISDFVGSGNLDVLEDDRYVVGIIDEGPQVHLYFFKKEKEE